MKCEFCTKEFKNLVLHQRTCNALSPLDEKEKTELIDKTKDSTDKRKEISKGDEVNRLEVKVNELTTNLNTLAGAVNKLVEIQTVKKEDVGKTGTGNAKSTKTEEKDETRDDFYMPPRFREIVDNTLSSEFGAKVTDFDDRTDFMLTIIVPQKYSSVPKEEYEKTADIRSRIIPRGLGENGVKEWCQLIRLNLNKYFTREGVQSPFSIN